MNYGRAIRTIRGARGLSQEDFSNLLGMNRSYIYRIESNERIPKIKTLEKIADVLEVPFYLFVLLSSEEKDVKNLSHEKTGKIAHNLLDVLVSTRKGSDNA